MDFFKNSLYRQDVETACKHVVHLEELFEKKVLITGATGLVGSFLADMIRFLNENYDGKIECWLLSREYSRLVERFGEENGYIHYICGDICEGIDMQGAVDYVIHAAADSYPALFKEDALGTLMKSIEGTRNVLELASRLGAQNFLFVSSGEVYGQASNCQHKETESGLVDILSPRSCYPLGKQAAENLCICYSKQRGLNVVIARLCHTFGPNAVSTDNRAHMQFIRNAVAGENIVLKSEGLQERSYMYVADSASALLSILINGKSCEAYNACSRETSSIRGFAENCANLAKVEVILEIPKKVNDLEKSPIDKQVLDCGKLEQLGWSSAFSIIQGNERSISILKEEEVI